MNLLEETKEAMRLAGKTEEDIALIIDEDSEGCCSWEEFCEMADISYGKNCNFAQVITTLVIVFDDSSRLERGLGECDEIVSEVWEFVSLSGYHTPPPALTSLFYRGVV